MLRRCAVVGLVLAACGGAPEDPLRARLDALVQAAEQRDPSAFADGLASRFQGNGHLGRADALDLVRRYFAAYESIDVELYDLRLDPPADGTRGAQFRVEFRGSARRVGGLDALLPPAASALFRVRAAPEDGAWRIVAAEWEEQAAPAP